MDWGRQNLLAVGLANHVYLWDAAVGDIILLKKMEDENNFICSVSWSKDGNFLAVGTSDCKVEVIQEGFDCGIFVVVKICNRSITLPEKSFVVWCSDLSKKAS